MDYQERRLLREERRRMNSEDEPRLSVFLQRLELTLFHTTIVRDVLLGIIVLLEFWLVAMFLLV